MAKKGGLLSDPGVQFLIALGATTVAGLAAKALYDRCTKTEKKEWRQALSHHGEVGLLALFAGLASGNPVAIGAGLGAVVTDLDDKDEWFSRKK
jgi:hypothetical protein